MSKGPSSLLARALLTPRLLLWEQEERLMLIVDPSVVWKDSWGWGFDPLSNIISGLALHSQGEKKTYFACREAIKMSGSCSHRDINIGHGKIIKTIIVWCHIWQEWGMYCIHPFSLDWELHHGRQRSDIPVLKCSRQCPWHSPIHTFHWDLTTRKVRNTRQLTFPKQPSLMNGPWWVNPTPLGQQSWETSSTVSRALSLEHRILWLPRHMPLGWGSMLNPSAQFSAALMTRLSVTHWLLTPEPWRTTVQGSTFLGLKAPGKLQVYIMLWIVKLSMCLW